MRTILIVTVGRSDYGLYRPVIDQIAAEPTLQYSLVVSGAHLGNAATVEEIRADRRPVAAEIPLPETGGGQVHVVRAMAVILAGMAAILDRARPDILLVLGDRFEMFAAAAAAVPFNIPIAHIHGGELSYGAIDDVFRHGITKMAHLHFAATCDYAGRIVRMGEEPWRVTVSGAPGLDTALKARLPDRAALSKRFGIPLDTPPVIVTFHPVTRQAGEEVRQVSELLAALRSVHAPLVFTAPNADGGSDTIRLAIEHFVSSSDRRYLVENFGSLNYLAMLREAAAAVGNSSSGLIETPAFELPTVNIGDRQEGRTRAVNVIDVPPQEAAIRAAVARALSPEFRASLRGMANPYGDGTAGERIVSVLKNIPLDRRLVVKRFHDGGEEENTQVLDALDFAASRSSQS